MAVRVGKLAAPVLARVKKTYLAKMRPGSDPRNELVNAYKDLSWDLARGISNAYTTVDNALEHIAKAPKLNATRCLKLLKQNGTDPRRVKLLHPLFRSKSVAEARALLTLCPQFLPDDPTFAAEVAGVRGKVEVLLKKLQKEEMKAAAERTWSRGNGNKALARAAMSFLRKDPAWGADKARGTRVLRVAVQGGWFVAERDIFKRPTKWGIPVHVAVRTKDTHKKLAQVFQLSLITPTAKKAPPFSNYWVGETWLILKKKVR